MLFNSFEFLLVFLPAAILIYGLVDHDPRLRTWVLIALSLVFYGYWDVRFLPLMVGSIVVNWWAARLFVADRTACHHHRRDRRQSAVVLGFFKYTNFLADNFAALLGAPVRSAATCSAARHQLLHLPSHHVPGRSRPRQRADLSARPLCALHLLLPAGDRGPDGALERGDATSSGSASSRRAGNALRARRDASSWSVCCRRSLIGRSDWLAHSIPIYESGADGPGDGWPGLDGARHLHSRCSSTSPAIPTSPLGLR